MGREGYLFLAESIQVINVSIDLVYIGEVGEEGKEKEHKERE